MKPKPFELLIAVSIFLSLMTCLLNPAWAESCPDNVSAYWKLDENYTGSYIDSIANINGICDSSCPSIEANGIVGGAKTFDGGTAGITAAANAAFDWTSDASFSIELWVKRNSGAINSGGEVMVGRIDGATSMQWRLEIRSDRTAAFKLVATNGTGDAAEDTVAGSKVIANDKWHHIVAVRDADLNENVLYVDGEVDASVQSLTYDAGFESATEGVNIGWINDTPEGRLQGTLDEVAIYHRVLTEKEIKSHYYLARGYCNELDTQIRIMPMGDSITKDRLGLDDPRAPEVRVGYRKRLYDNLRDNNYWFDMIGSEADGDPSPSVFDNNHAGWGGIELLNLYDILTSGRNTKVGEEEDVTQPSGRRYLNQYPTDFILLHIGTNDVANQSANFPTTEIGQLGDVLDEIDADNDQTTVVLAKIINRPTHSGNHADTIEYNSRLDELARTRIDDGDKIILVDMEQNADLVYVTDATAPYTGGDFIDTIHPNPSGYPKMGSTWFSVLDTVLPQFVAPQVTSTAVTEAAVDILYNYTVTVSGTGPFTFSLVDAPTGMEIDSQTGVIGWTPDTEGDFDVNVNVTNTMAFGDTGETTQDFTITVTRNSPPVITTTAPLTANNEVLYTYNAAADDADGDTLTWSLSNQPAGMTVNSATGIVTWTPDADITTSGEVTLTVTDGISPVSQAFTIEVSKANTPSDEGGGGGGGSGCFISAILPID